ncbi:protein FAR1-RELATED SEQUENCE 5-like [Silene latifolia]|uniref:protein FAR1-RELATED SEQUENCE 5-like n=1 Tax=Silene latifolia TaxID=37657 RepID=UPI003D78264A
MTSVPNEGVETSPHQNENVDLFHEESPILVHREVQMNEIKIGTSFTNEDDAYDYYNRYAISRGFSIRKDVIRRNKNGKIISRTFVCSKEGESEAQSENRLKVRTGCKAFVRIKENEGVWILTNYYDEHNHEMADDSEKHLLRSGRNISKANEKVISSMVAAGFGATQTFAYLADEHGGEEKVQFTLEDLNNHIQTKRTIHLEAGDAQSLVNQFKQQHKNDPMFSYSVQLDSECHMSNFFWRDGKSLIDYECFGNVVIFDCAHRTNKYGMICAPFTGINHHKKNVVFGCAFLIDETIPTFVWLFKTFLEEMGNRHPVTIFTDQAQAMANAIKQVFPNTKHRLCMWHLSENAGKHLSHHLANPGFKESFRKCVYGCNSEMEFETYWAKMIADYNLTGHKWLSDLYDLRQKWCPAFSLDIFSAAVRSTQRSESTNSVFRKISCKTMTLSRIVYHIQKVAERWRSKERKLDFRGKQGVPLHAARNSGILRQAAQIYTVKIFTEFRKEFYDTLHLVLEGVTNNEVEHVYILRQETQISQFYVHFNPVCYSVACSCKKFESMGLLCCHALKVLNLNGVSSMPSCYMLKRWTKDVKKGERVVENTDLSQNSCSFSATLARSELMLKAYKSIDNSVLDSMGFNIAKKHLATWAKEIENHVVTMNLTCEHTSSESEKDSEVEVDISNSVHITKIKNPAKRRPKGESNARLKGALERKKKRTPPEKY